MGRRLAVVLAIALVSALSGCGGSSQPVRRIALVRAVPASANENALYEGLARSGIARKRLVIVGGGATSETYTTEADASAAIDRWVRSGVDAIVALSTTGALAAKKAAPSVPVLFLSTDPSATGLLQNERRPEGHLTGMTYRVPADRTLALAGDAFPGMRRVGCLYTPGDPAAGPAQRELERGAKALSLELRCVPFSGPDDAADAARAVVAAGVDAVVLVNAPTVARSVPQLKPALVAAKVPVISNQPSDFAELILQPDSASVYDDLGRQLARVLKGAAVRDVPVQDPAHFELVANVSAATAIGRTIGDVVLRQATRVVR